jgi:2'-5' RNA ligase
MEAAGGSLAARRLFFAFWPDPATREAMHHAARKVLRRGDGRPVPAANLHVTVAFLGSVAESLRPEVERIGARVAAQGAGEGAPGGAALELVFDRVACWPKPQVLVAVCSAPPPVAGALAARLWQALRPLPIPPDGRPYTPHVTLARKVRKPPADLDLKPVSWPVMALTLVESVTGPAGARYEPIASWSF